MWQICRFTSGFKLAKELADDGRIGGPYYVEIEYAHDYQDIISADGRRSDSIEVTAYSTHKLLQIVDYDDANIAIMRFPNNVIGKVFISTGCKRDYTMRSVFYGTKGTIICDNTSPTIALCEADADGHAGKPQKLDVNIANHNTFGEFRVFADSIPNDTPVHTDAVTGAKTIAVCMAIIESAKTLKPVKPNYDFD